MRRRGGISVGLRNRVSVFRRSSVTHQKIRHVSQAIARITVGCGVNDVVIVCRDEGMCIRRLTPEYSAIAAVAAYLERVVEGHDRPLVETVQANIKNLEWPDSIHQVIEKIVRAADWRRWPDTHMRDAVWRQIAENVVVEGVGSMRIRIVVALQNVPVAVVIMMVNPVVVKQVHEARDGL